MAKSYVDKAGLLYYWGKLKTYLTTNFQAKLVSGTNIKTINNTSLLGSGNISISGGSGEVNQNAFSNVKVGSSTIAADAKTDTLEMVAGNGISLTADTTNDKVTINQSSPYIVYQDTNIRLWSDNTFEIWAQFSKAMSTMSTFGSSTKLYSGTFTLAFRSYLTAAGISTSAAVSLDCQIASVRTTGGSGYTTVWTCYRTSGADSVTIRIVGTANNPGTVTGDVYLKGRIT